MSTRSRTGKRWLLYGAYGYTGRLILERGLAVGMPPVVAGRDHAKTRALAESHGLPWAAFDLADPDRLRAAARDVDLVLNAAGPFSATWEPVLRACLAEGRHYVDITGEIEVLEAMHAMAPQARVAAVHVVPAVGFDVVPTDCAAVLAAGGHPEPQELNLAFHLTGGPSRGTTRTAIERLGHGGAVRREGRIVSVPLGSVASDIPFTDRTRRGVAIPWGDVSTAYHSTGIPDITVYAVLPRALPALGRLLGRVFTVTPIRRVAEWAVNGFIDGPGARQLGRGYARVRAEVRDRSGRVSVVELVTPNAYALTASSAVAAVQRILGGDVLVGPGVHTPAVAFGPDFVLGLPGVKRVR